MSGFFSLGGANFEISKEEEEQVQRQQNDHHHHHQNQDQQEDSIITPNSLYLFKNEEIYSKGFELWQQYYQFHHHRHQPSPSHYDLAVAGGSINRRRSSISAGVDDLCLNSSNSNCSNNIYSMRQGGYGISTGGDHGSVGGSSSGTGSGGGVNCQDCGNQAKKDCQHMRCRTCCKSRGFQCQTHVKSTWVPAAKRRERQQQLQTLSQHHHQHDNLGLMMRGGPAAAAVAAGGGDQNTKRLREDHHLITAAGHGGDAVVVSIPSAHHHHHQNPPSALEMGHFPAEVSSPAVFRCVRVSAIDEAEEQLAYQTAVNIGGHVFKGILYDHGRYGGGESSSGGGDHGGGTQQHLNLITSGSTMGVATTTSTATTAVNPNVSSIDPSTIYPTPLNAFMAGTQFFPPPRS